MRFGLDVSNWTGGPNSNWDNFAGAGVVAVLPQAIAPPAGYPAGVTADQVQWALDHGMLVIPYIWKWFGTGIADIQRRLDLLTPFSGQIDHIMLDVEDTTVGALMGASVSGVPTPPNGHDQRIKRQPPPVYPESIAAVGSTMPINQRIDELFAAFALLDTFPTKSGLLAGWYGGAWYNGPYLGNPNAFSNRPLWLALYDGNPDVTAWSPFGGWQELAIKQFLGTSTVGGVGNVDQNVLADTYLVAAAPTSDPEPTPAPDNQVDQGWQDKKDMVVETAGAIKVQAQQILDESNRRGGARKTTLQSLAHGIMTGADKILA